MHATRPNAVPPAARVAAVVLATALASLLVPPAAAICTSAHLIQSKPVVSNPALPDATYIYTRGEGPATGPRFRGAFWAMGNGDPQVGVGDDNGGFDSRVWTVAYYSREGDGYARATRLEVTRPVGALTWAASEQIDGCVQNAPPAATRCTCLMLEDGWADGSYFALLADAPDAGENYDFAPWTPGPVVRMARIPGPRVTDVVEQGGEARLTVELDPFDGGIFVDPACEACADVRYTVLAAEVPRRTDETLDRVAGVDFRAIDGQPEAGTPAGESIELTTACGDASTELRLAVQLRFDSGFRTRYVSGDEWRLHCGSDLSRPARPRTRAVPGADRGRSTKDLAPRR